MSFQIGDLVTSGKNQWIFQIVCFVDRQDYRCRRCRNTLGDDHPGSAVEEVHLRAVYHIGGSRPVPAPGTYFTEIVNLQPVPPLLVLALESGS